MYTATLVANPVMISIASRSIPVITAIITTPVSCPLPSSPK